VRLRILVTVIAVAVVAVAAFFVPAAIAIRSRDADAQRLEVQREAATAVAGIDPAHPGDAQLPNDGEHEYGLYGSDGSLLTGDGPARADAVVTSALERGDDLQEVNGELVAALLVDDEDGRGEPVVVRVAESTDEASAATTRAMTGLALGAIGILSAAGFVAWALTIRLTRPIEDLRAAAAQLGAGDFTIAVEPTGVAELDEVGEALTTAGQRIGTAMARERAFSADASHQLRTPITAMRTAIEAEQLAPRADPATILDELLAETDHLESTVTTLLELARETHTDRSPVDLRDIVQQARSTWAREAAVTHRSIRWSPPPEPVTTTASGAALGHVLDVLLENALRHGSGDISLGLDRIGHGARLRVGDQGRVDAPVDSLFERRGSSDQGTGIGLHLARSLIEAEGGRLRLATEEPTTFEVTVPSS
jgi:signal transduction histidine kinase